MCERWLETIRCKHSMSVLWSTLHRKWQYMDGHSPAVEWRKYQEQQQQCDGYDSRETAFVQPLFWTTQVYVGLNGNPTENQPMAESETVVAFTGCHAGFHHFTPTWDCGNSSMTEEREVTFPDHRSLAKLHGVWDWKKKEFFFHITQTMCAPSTTQASWHWRRCSWGRVDGILMYFWHEWRIMMYCSKCRLDRKYVSSFRNTQRMMLTSARTQGLPGVVRLCAIQIFQTCATGDGCGCCWSPALLFQ